MKKSLIFTICVVFLLSFASQVYAQEKLSFYAAVKCALENNNDLKAMKKALSANERDIGIARSNIMPKAKFNEDFISTNNPAQVFALKLNQTRLTSGDFAGAPGSFNNPNNITNFLTAISLEQPIYNRKSNIAIAMAKKEHSAQGYTYLRRQEELVNKVAQAYLAVNTNQEFVKVTVLDITDAKEHLRIAQSRYKNEVGLYSDVLRAQTAEVEAQQNYVSAVKNLNIAQRALGLLLGKQEKVDIIDSIPILSIKNADYYNKNYLCRNDIKAMEINVENAKNGIKLANADIFPTLGANASYNLYNNSYPFGAEGNNYVAGAFLNWDIFDGNKRKYETLKAKDKEAEAKEYLEGLKKAVSYKVFESYSNVEESAKNFELALTSLKSAEEGKRLVFKRWESSLSPFVDLMDAQTNLDRARANVIKSKNNYKSALITLSFESGIITKELAID
ncbi:MAG: TolC family protein [Candidatus Gastranaerophilaceae bacterium]